jgi:DNA-binding transcriptional regulator YdaS (Cro superfamily)
MNAIERAIKCLGSQAALASAIGVKQPTVSEWLRGDRQVPAERCPLIERETRSRATAEGNLELLVTCEELRPDVEWGVLRDQASITAPVDAIQGA